MNTLRFCSFVAFAALVAACSAPEAGYAIGVCRTDANQFTQNLDGTCGGTLIEHTDNAIAWFKAIGACASAPRRLERGTTYELDIDLASEAATCTSKPGIYISGANAETDMPETVLAREFDCGAVTAERIRFTVESDLEDPDITLFSGDQCASMRVRSIRKTEEDS